MIAPIRVLVVDNSPTVRALLQAVLEADPAIRVIGEARDGGEAVDMTHRLRPSLVVMDIEMPNVDGFEATRRIMAEAPTPIVIVTASRDPHDVTASLTALRYGALALLGKPVAPGARGFVEQAAELVRTVKDMAEVKVIRRRTAAPPVPAPRRRLPATTRIVAVAASTGGPPALGRLLGALPADLDAPILVVQHIGRGFTAGLARWLDTVSRLPVRIAEHDAPLCSGTVYLAPDDHHLGVASRDTLSLSSAPSIDGFRPSGTFLFDSVGREFGPEATGVILTGMGRDGVEGLRRLRDAGGTVVAQDEATCVVFGMPGEAVACGLADLVLPLPDIPAQLVRLVARRRNA